MTSKGQQSRFIAYKNEDDEEELLEKLIRHTTYVAQVSNIDDFVMDERKSISLFEAKPVVVKEDRPTALSKKIKCKEVSDNHKSLAKAKRGCEHVKFADDVLLVRLRPSSADRKRPYIDRRKMHTLGKIEPQEAPKICTSYEYPTLWDYTKGQIRRNSFS